MKGEPAALGMAKLELNKDLIRPMKRVPQFSKSENGKYQIASSQSDKNIASSIKFFRNNLASFVKYKDKTKNHPLHEKYSVLVIVLNTQFEGDEFDNVLSEEEMKKFVLFDVVLP